MSRLRSSALFALLVVLTTSLGLGTLLPTSAVWSDNVWATAKVTTRTSTTTSYPGGLTPDSNTKFTTDPVWTRNDVNQACTTLSVSTDSTTAVKWSVRLDTTAQPWNGATTDYNLTYGYLISSTLVGGRYLTISGDPGSSPVRDKITKGSVYVFEVCNYHAGMPPIADSSWLNLTVSNPVKSSGSQVCKTVTAVALGKTPFWFRWQATVPTADMFALLPTKTTFWWTYSNYSVLKDPDPSVNPAAPSTVVVTSATNDTASLLKDTKRYDFTMCLNGS